MATVSYPYDPTGLSPANKVDGETQVLSQVNTDPYRYFIPNFAPFCKQGFVAVGRNALGAQVPMTFGIDYIFSSKYIGASRATGVMWFGAVSVINKNIQGPVTLTYQTLGGQYAADRNYVIQTIAQNNYNPRRIAWDQVTNAPTTFPPSPHTEDIADMKGMGDLIDALNRIEIAVANQNPALDQLRAHMLDHNDPHETLRLIPTDYVRRPELLAHTQDFNDPHRTLG